MTITQLKYTLSVAENGNFTVASEKCFVTQPTLSMQVQKLEDRLGVRLLNRTTRRLSLTDEGRAFYDHCRRILDEARDAVDALDSLGTGPRGRLAAPFQMACIIDIIPVVV